MSRPWRYVAVSVAGERSTREGRRCADASAARWDGTSQALVLVAADGAGTARCARSGAQTVVEEVTARAFEGLLDDQERLVDGARLEAYLVDLARSARRRLEDASSAADPASSVAGAIDTGPTVLDDYATTLLITLATPCYVAALQVGDGYVLRVTQETVPEALFQPNRGRYANETAFLTSFASFDELLARGQVQVRSLPVAATSALGLITDGLEHVVMDMRAGGVPHAPLVASLLRELQRFEPEVFAERLERYLLQSQRIRERSDDDKTLVLAVDLDHAAAAVAALGETSEVDTVGGDAHALTPLGGGDA